MLCLKAWSRDESDKQDPEYIEWCFPLPGKELTSDYLCSIIERFNQARKEGFWSRGTKEASSYVKETARLNGLGTLLSEIGIQAYFSSADRSFPCLWIFDGYEDDAGNENAGCLIKLSYICLEEDDSKWLLSVECSRTSDEKTYPGEPVLKEPVVRMLIPEDDELQDVQRYGRILEVVESTTMQ